MQAGARLTWALPGIRWLVAPACLALLIVALPACSALSDDKSPGEVVQATLMAARDSDYDAVESYFSEDMQRQMKGSLGAFLGGIAGFSNYYTRNGDLQKVIVLDQSVQEDRAEVRTRLVFPGPPAGPPGRVWVPWRRKERNHHLEADQGARRMEARAERVLSATQTKGGGR